MSAGRNPGAWDAPSQPWKAALSCAKGGKNWTASTRSELNKNPSSSNKIRTADTSSCTGSLSTASSNSDRTTPHPSRAPPAHFHFASHRPQPPQLSRSCLQKISSLSALSQVKSSVLPFDFVWIKTTLGRRFANVNLANAALGPPAFTLPACGRDPAAAPSVVAGAQSTRPVFSTPARAPYA